MTAETKFTWSAEYEYESRDSTRWRFHSRHSGMKFPIELRSVVTNFARAFMDNGRMSNSSDSEFDIIAQHPIAPPVSATVPQWCKDAAEEIEAIWEATMRPSIAAIIAKHAPKEPVELTDEQAERIMANALKQQTCEVCGGEFDTDGWCKCDHAKIEALPTDKKKLFPVFSMSDVFGTMTFHQQHEGRYATGETPRLGDVVRAVEGIDSISTGDTLTIERLVRGGDDVCRYVGLKEHVGLDYFPQRFALVRRAEFAHVPVNSLNSSNGSDSGYDDRDMVASEADAANELLTKKINEIAGLRQQIETLRVQWNDERNRHEEEYAALRRRGIKFVKFGGVLEAIDGRCQEKPDNLTYEEIESRIERCVVSEDARDDVSSKELQEICSLFLKIRDHRDVMRDALEKCQGAFADETIVNGPGNGKGKYYAIGVAASVELALKPIEGAE